MSAAPTNHCPKCAFESRDLDQCERCGIIFDKMHTILDMRPLGALAAGMVSKQTAPLDPAEASTQQVQKVVLPSGNAPSRVAAALQRARSPESLDPVMEAPSRPAPVVQAPPPSRVAAAMSKSATVSKTSGVDLAQTDREIHLVPRAAPKAPEASFAWGRLFLVVFVIAGAGWGYVTWRDSLRAANERTTVVADISDPAYYDLALERMIADARTSFRMITDADASEAQRLEMATRVRFTLDALRKSTVVEPQKAAFDEALTALSGFLETEVPKAIDQARALDGRTEPVSPAALSRAAAALARSRQPPP